VTSYYGGPRATTNQIRKLNATDFASLVANYLNAAHPLSITRAAYHALSEDDQKEAKNGPYICACSFREGSTRCDSAADRLNLVCLDLDNDGSDNLSYLTDIHLAPDLAIDQLHPFNAVIYETASSTPENPRLRIMVDADLPASREVLRRAVRLVCEKLGIPDRFKGLRESTVISQPMFRPVQFAGEEGSPVLATRTTGRALTEADLTDATDDEVKRYAWGGEDDPTCGLDQLPLQNLTPEDIREALHAIDPDIGYEQWTHIAAALRHQFRTEEHAEEAYWMFDEWSAKGTKYRGEKETYLKWKSFKPDTMGKQAVTIRSMFHYAQEAGWKPVKVAAITRESMIEWIENCTCVDTLQSEGPLRIAAMPFRSTTGDQTMLETLRRKLIRLGAHGVSIATLKADMKRERKKKAKDEEREIPGWLRPYCYCPPMGKFIHVNKGSSLGIAKEAFDLTFGKNIPEDSEGRRPNASVFAMDVVHLRTVDGTTYDPRFAEDRFFSFKGKDYLNEYNPASVPELDHTLKEKVGSIFYHHLLTLTGAREFADVVLQYLAHVVQRPGVKIRWMPLIQSAEGAGKSILYYLLDSAIGEGNSKIVNPSQFNSGSWNDWAVGCQFLVIEELMLKGKDRQATANLYKDFLTNQTINLVAKFKNAQVVQNVANAIAFTNYHSPVHLDESSRRYYVIKSPIQTAAQVKQLVENGHFIPLDKIIKRRGGALRAYLLDVKIPDDFPTDGPAPKSRFTDQLIAESRNHVLDDIKSIIEDAGDPLIAHDLIHYARLESMLDLRNNHALSHFLYVLGYEPVEACLRFDVGGSRTQVWMHRQNFDNSLDDPVSVLRSRVNEDTTP
jgi:hypothetical protein